MTLKEAVKALLAECPDFDSEWQGVGMYAVRMKLLVDLADALEADE